jgi:4-deoxy-L-threo-5-hexosulose-uronate ketol-isomerase
MRFFIFQFSTDLRRKKNNMKILHSVHPDDFKNYGTDKIRERFLLSDLKQNGKGNFVYTHYDRMVAGLIKPDGNTISLETDDALKSEYFLERREIGIINVGGEGKINADGKSYSLNKLDCLYIGKGVKQVSFSSAKADATTVFFILSNPAHASYPTTQMKHEESSKAVLGVQPTANQRTLCKYIHKDGIKSCQLVMGLTLLHEGSVWNTMPPHTHDRRMEVYFYFDVPEGQMVFHYMGQPQETRHILIGNHQAVVSPPWSIHSGSGTSNYGFIWGMAGENMEFTDMDAAAIAELR